MEDKFQIAFVEKTEESAWGIISHGIHDYNVKQAGDDQYQRLCFVLLDDDQIIAGGVFGEMFWDWLHIDLLWLIKELRAQGYGHQLLTRVKVRLDSAAQDMSIWTRTASRLQNSIRNMATGFLVNCRIVPGVPALFTE